MDEILPPGFEKQVDNRGRTFYIDHNTQSTHWKLPEVMNICYIYMLPSYSHRRRCEFAAAFVLAGTGIRAS